jgi:hypothetical protein
MKESNEEQRLARAVETGIERWFGKLFYFWMVVVILGVAGG